MDFKSLNSKKLIDLIKDGKVGVLPTDTIYGLCGSALKKRTVERIYKLRKRNTKKPMIILISSINQLSILNIKVDSLTKKILDKYWPGKISIVLPCSSKKYDYLHRGNKSLAFRIPDKKDLVNLISKTGPLVAPSANIEGKDPSYRIEEAKEYFGEKIDFYADQGILFSKPSTVLELKDGRLTLIRKGALSLPK